MDNVSVYTNSDGIRTYDVTPEGTPESEKGHSEINLEKLHDVYKLAKVSREFNKIDETVAMVGLVKALSLMLPEDVNDEITRLAGTISGELQYHIDHHEEV